MRTTDHRLAGRPPSAARFAAMLLAGLAAGCSQQMPGPVTQPAAPVSTGQVVGAALRNKIQVDFPSGSDRLTPDANKQLDVAARLFRDVRPVSMFSEGYSDASGDEWNNLLLAARRARVVKAALVARGIPADQILMRSYGQSDPIDRSHPDDPANRRVLVTWDIL